MEKILFINACVRPNSRTLELANCVLERLLGNVEEVTLYNEELSPLSLKEMEVRNEASKLKDFSNNVFNLAKQFSVADVIVIAAPYWDLMFPAILKNYLEKITVNGLTFAYGENGIPDGLCKAKKLIYVTTSGGPIVYDFGYDYVKTLAKCFYGINNVQCIKAQGLDVYGADATKILNGTKNTISID